MLIKELLQLRSIHPIEQWLTKHPQSQAKSDTLVDERFAHDEGEQEERNEDTSDTNSCSILFEWGSRGEGTERRPVTSRESSQQPETT